MLTSILRFLFLIGAGLLIYAGCDSDSTPTNIETPGCGTSQTVEQSFILTGYQRSALLVSPEARKDCIVTMSVTYHWDDVRVEWQPLGEYGPPPLFFYHQIYPGFYNVEGGQPTTTGWNQSVIIDNIEYKGWIWRTVVIGNAKSFPNPTVRYKLAVVMRSPENGPIKVTLSITYFPASNNPDR